jgi:tetratricopeptide (TPR) repeat protein
VESAVDSLVGDMMGKFDDAMQSNLDDIQKHQDKIGDLRGQIQDNAENIAAAQADLNDAFAPIKKSTLKKLADRRAADAKANMERANRIRDAQKKLSDLVEKQNQYNQAINEEQAAINQDSDEYWKLNAARAQLATQLADEQAKLNELTDARDANNQAIDDEQKILEDATRTRDDYNQSLRDQYGAQEDISKEMKLSDYVKDLQDQIVATQQFTTAIQELRKRGLNDELYQSLLAKGPTDAMPFVQQLLDGGQEAVDNLNYLGTALDKAAGDIGDQASSSLYQAGVDAADGILKGLQSKAVDIQAQMDSIAQYMVTALNNALGIHSPSRVMAEIGSYAAQGLIKGLGDSADQISKASAGAGQSAIDGMKKTISGLGRSCLGERGR